MGRAGDVVEELLPHEAETERLPDQPLAERFEDLSYDDYAIVWPQDDNTPRRLTRTTRNMAARLAGPREWCAAQPATQP